jgi:hypothetical protein
MNPSTNELYTRIGALYVALVESEERIKILEEQSNNWQRTSEKSAEVAGNALAHLEQFDKEVHDKIMAGETVPVLIPQEVIEENLKAAKEKEAPYDGY